MRNIHYIFILLILPLSALLPNKSFAQTGTIINDTLQITVTKAPLLDSALVNVSIFNLLESPDFGNGKVIVNQSWAVKRTFSNYIQTNNQKKKNGFRIRIFFDNAQNARTQSEYIKRSFNDIFPNIPAYLSSSNPFFKVTVGNFRTRSDAAKALDAIKLSYPAAFIVKETIDYPAI